MSADIEKLKVIDPRIVQSRPKYAVEAGALSLTNAPFNAIAATTSQHTYNIYVPSENVFVDRKLLWSSTVRLRSDISLANAPLAGESLFVPGRDFALCALPLNSLCSTTSATINDTTTVINSQDVQREILRLCSFKKNRQIRSAPTMLDKYQDYNDAFGTLANPNAGYDGMTDYDNVPNGAYFNLQFTAPNGSPLATSANLRTPAWTGSGINVASYASVNGIPVAPEVWDSAFSYSAGNIVQYGSNVWVAVNPTIAVAPASPAWEQIQNGVLDWSLYFVWRSTEPIILSPFVFSDEFEWDTGLFGISNIQLIMNLVSSPNRVIRSSTRAGRSITQTVYSDGVANPFVDSVLNVQFMTPALSVPLPPKSVVPYMEFPRYITQYQNGTIQPGQTGQIVSQTITLPQIPDLLLVYCKATNYANTEGDYYFPIATSLDGVRNPLTVNFDNFSGLLSSTTAEQLYQMSVHNGLDMDYNTFFGLGHSAGGSYSYTNSLGNPIIRQQGQNVPLVGSILVLKMGQDITLQEGQAPSLVGNFTLQFNLTVKNNTSVAQTPQLYVITANSGFFESIRGSSRILKGILSEQDIISAPLAPMAVRSELERMVGGLSFGSLANVLSKAKDVYHATKPAVSAIKDMLPSEGKAGKAKNVLGALGYGTGAGTGSGTGAGKKSLAHRLM